MYLIVGKIVILVSIACFLLLMFRDRYYGTLAYTIVYFTRPTELFPALGKIHFELIIACVILTFILMDDTAKANLRRMAGSSISKAFMWFLSAIFISIPFSFGVMKSLDWFIDLIKLLLFCVMIIATIDSDRKIKMYLWLYAILIFWIALVPFINYLSGNYYYAQGVKRISASTRFFSNPNVLACTIAQSIPLIWVLLFLGKGSKKKAFLKCVIICLFLGVGTATIIFTGSRGGFMALLGVGFFIWIRSKRRLLGLLIGIVVVGIVWVNMGKEYRQRQETIIEMGESDQSAKSRIESVIYAFEMLGNRPLFGYGFGCYANARFILGHGWLWPHNIAAQLIGELGIYGILTFSFFVITVFKNTRSIRRNRAYSVEYHRINDAFENSFFSQFVIGISQHNLHLYMLYFVASLLLINGSNAEKAQIDEVENNHEEMPPKGPSFEKWVSSPKKEKEGEEENPFIGEVESK